MRKVLTDDNFQGLLESLECRDIVIYMIWMLCNLISVYECSISFPSTADLRVTKDQHAQKYDCTAPTPTPILCSNS